MYTHIVGKKNPSKTKRNALFVAPNLTAGVSSHELLITRMAYMLSCVCFLTAAIGWFISWCFGSSELAAFTIPCVHNGWDRAEKANAVLKSAYYYLALGLVLGAKDIISSYRNGGMNRSGYAQIRSEASLAEYATHEVCGHKGIYEAAVYAPLVSKRKVVRIVESSSQPVGDALDTCIDGPSLHEMIARPNQYGGTDVEMRKVPTSSKRPPE